MMLHRHFSQVHYDPPPTELPTIQKTEKPKKVMRQRKKSSFPGKVAAFPATRNWYDKIIVSAKSMFCNSDADRAVFVIEDDTFPTELPKEIEIVNASDNEYFRPGGPNYSSHFSYLCLSRAAYGYFLSDYGRVLSLDSDLVVVDDISDLWDVDLNGNYCAGVIDRGIGRPGYYNAGVILMDLDRIRDDGITDAMIDLLNRQYRPWTEQDALNECCGGKILELPTRYNESPVTGRTDNPAIVHFVGTNKTGGSNRQYRHYWNQYEQMTWEEVSEIRREKYGKPLTF